MRDEVHDHPFKKDPESLLLIYPGVKDALDLRVDRVKSLLGWREFEILIQYEGWTCELNFHWRYRRGHYYIEAVKIYRVCLAPSKHEQYWLH